MPLQLRLKQKQDKYCVRVLDTGIEAVEVEASGIWPHLCCRYFGSNFSFATNFTFGGLS
jgi:hypothetical protein